MALKVFGSPINSMEITNKNEFILMLNRMGSSEAENHTFMPSGGGLYLMGPHVSDESGLVKLNFNGNAEVVDPVCLTFHPMDDDQQCWYYSIHTTDFSPNGVYVGNSFEDNDELKFLVEKYFGHYLELPCGCIVQGF